MLRGSFPHPSSRQAENVNPPRKHTPHYQKRKGKALYPTCQISQKSQGYHGVRPVETFRRQSHRTIFRLFKFPPGEPERAIPSDYYGPPIMSASERTVSLFIVRARLQCPYFSAIIPSSGPPRRGDFNEVINSNLSWSQFAAPVPAGWRERFLQDRQWEHHIERRAYHEYSDKEREVEHTAVECQRRQLGVTTTTSAEMPYPFAPCHPCSPPIGYIA